MSPQLKVTYFAFPGRGEPARLALALGGIAFENCEVGEEAWAAQKPGIAPLLLPLLEVDGKTVSQSDAMSRYACKLAKLDGKPLYPEDPYEALLVDELVDQVSEAVEPMAAAWEIEDEAKRNAKRTELMVKGGPVEKWAALIDGVLAKSKSGFALFDRLTMADIHIFVSFCLFRSGVLPGIPKDSLDHLVHICKHKDKIANVPQVKDYYKGNENPAYAFLKA